MDTLEYMENWHCFSEWPIIGFQLEEVHCLTEVNNDFHLCLLPYF